MPRDNILLPLRFASTGGGADATVARLQKSDPKRAGNIKHCFAAASLARRDVDAHRAVGDTILQLRCIAQLEREIRNPRSISSLHETGQLIPALLVAL